MGRTLEELDATMSPQEFWEWAAYFEVEPWGAPTEDHRWQTLCDITFRAGGGTVKDIKWFDRDPEETARIEAKKAAYAQTLDAKLEDYFERRIAGGR